MPAGAAGAAPLPGKEFQKAVRDGDLERLKQLHKRCTSARRPELLAFTGSGGLSALHWAASKGKPEHVRCVYWLVRQAGSGVGAAGKEGKTPLHCAVGNNRPATVHALLELGAEPAAADDAGQTCLSLAQGLGNAAVLAEFEAFAPAEAAAAAGAESEDDDTETDEEAEEAEEEAQREDQEEQQEEGRHEFLGELLSLIDAAIGCGDLVQARESLAAGGELEQMLSAAERQRVEPAMEQLGAYVAQLEQQAAAAAAAAACGGGGRRIEMSLSTSATVQRDMLPTSSLPIIMAASPIAKMQLPSHAEELASPVDASRLAALAQLGSDEDFEDSYFSEDGQGDHLQPGLPWPAADVGGGGRDLGVDEYEIELHPLSDKEASTDDADDEDVTLEHIPAADLPRAVRAFPAAGLMPMTKPPPPPPPPATAPGHRHGFPREDTGGGRRKGEGGGNSPGKIRLGRPGTSPAARQADAMRQLRARSPLHRRNSGDAPGRAAGSDETLGFSPSPVSRNGNGGGGLHARAERSLRKTVQSVESTSAHGAYKDAQASGSEDEQAPLQPGAGLSIGSVESSLLDARAAYVGRASSLSAAAVSRQNVEQQPAAAVPVSLPAQQAGRAHAEAAALRDEMSSKAQELRALQQELAALRQRPTCVDVASQTDISAVHMSLHRQASPNCGCAVTGVRLRGWVSEKKSSWQSLCGARPSREPPTELQSPPSRLRNALTDE